MKKIRNRKDLQITDLLIAHGPAGYGVYVMLTQYLSERKSLRRKEDIARIAYELHAPAEMVRSVLEDFDIFTLTEDGEFANEAPTPKPNKPSDNSDNSEPSDSPDNCDNPDNSETPQPRFRGKIPVKRLLNKPHCRGMNNPEAEGVLVAETKTNPPYYGNKKHQRHTNREKPRYLLRR